MSWRKAAAALTSLFAGLLFCELFLVLSGGVSDLFLLSYEQGIVFNRPNFSNPYAFVPNRFLRSEHFVPGPGPTCEGLIPKASRPDAVMKSWVQTNREGLRAAQELEVKRRPESKVRLLNLGDSIGFGWPVPPEQSYLEVARQDLPSAEVVNCSLIGASTPILLDLYQRKCSKFEVDVVIAQLAVDLESLHFPDYMSVDRYGPDLRLMDALIAAEHADFVRKHVQPILGAGSLKLTKTQPHDDAIRDHFEPKLPFYHQLHLVRFVENNVVANFWSRLPQPRRLIPWVPPLNQGPTAIPTIYFLEKLRREVEERDARLLVLLVPTIRGWCDAQRRERATLTMLRRYLEKSGYATLDFVKIFHNHTPEQIYFLDEIHPNARGYEIIGKKVADWVRSEFEL